MSKKDWVLVDDRLPEVNVTVIIVLDMGNGRYIYSNDRLKEDGTWCFHQTAGEKYGEKLIAWCPIPELSPKVLKRMRR